jgi:hypothetical protein
MIYPEWADIHKLAYYFIADYPCEAHEYPDMIRKVAEAIAYWQKTWKNVKLLIIPYFNQYILYDNRGIDGQEKKLVLDFSTVKEIMTSGVYHESAKQKWAVEEKLGVIVDGWYVSLLTASKELLLQFEDHSSP